MPYILHITDLHFDSSARDTPQAYRENVLDKLVEFISDSEKKPELIVISGDVANRGAMEDYIKAKSFIEKLLKAFKIDKERLIISPGNHDVSIEKTTQFFSPTDNNQADSSLSIENLQPLLGIFEHYIDFCKDLGLLPLQINKSDNYLIGYRDIGDIRFVVLNSAWFFRNNKYRDEMYLGLPHIEILENDKIFKTEKLLIAVFHHPSESLNKSETNSYGNRVASFNSLASKVDIILNGHTHTGEARNPDLVANHAYVIKSGATYAGKDTQNIFNLIHIEKDSFDLSIIKYDPSDREWRIAKEVKENKIHRFFSTKNDCLTHRRLGAEPCPSKFSQRCEKADITLANLKDDSLNSRFEIVWPMVPRTNLTIIHKAQAMAIKQLRAICNNLTLKIIIANSGVKENDDDIAFLNKVKKYLLEYLKVQIDINDTYLSDYYSEGERYENYLASFCKVSSVATLNDLISFNEKNYSDSEKKERREKPLLDNLRPILTASAVNTLYNNNYKTIVLAGEDERTLYRILERSLDRDYFGCIYIPTLKLDESSSANQEKSQSLHWSTYGDFLEALKKGNFREWLFKMFYCFNIDKNIKTSNCNPTECCNSMNADTFAQLIYDEYINS